MKSTVIVAAALLDRDEQALGVALRQSTVAMIVPDQSATTPVILTDDDGVRSVVFFSGEAAASRWDRRQRLAQVAGDQVAALAHGLGSVADSNLSVVDVLAVPASIRDHIRRELPQARLNL